MSLGAAKSRNENDYVNFEACVLEQLSTLPIAPSLGVVIGLRVAGNPDAERLSGALILLVAAVLCQKF